MKMDHDLSHFRKLYRGKGLEGDVGDSNIDKISVTCYNSRRTLE